MTRVLVPVAVLDGETVSAGLMELLSTMDVTVLGYHVLPEQTPPDQARSQFGDRATAALDDLSEEFRNAGGAADHRLVFTQNRDQSIDRVAEEVGASALGISGTTGDVEQLLVSLTGDVDVGQIAAFTVDLIGDREIAVTLFAAGDDAGDGRLGTAAETLDAAGIETETRLGDGPAFDALIDAVSDHDGIVMGEPAASLSSFLFGSEAERVASASVGPVLVVREDDQGESSE
ncbi:universal stress protein [Halovenus sp. WSH3]|uniref:Universal stress protein n=1 Tax=Halovenus carboxidivorans TaxID=2692199 RepID=A0A6B0T648_9EURY|nr:universal stress protein [Halovenus carboxidivorans]MXR50350.1 universal stress protein [Halovenus carboxidivorans]